MLLPPLLLLQPISLLCSLPCLLLVASVTLPSPQQRAWLRRQLQPRMAAIVMQQLPGMLHMQQLLRSRSMDTLTLLTEITVSLHFYVASLPILYFMGHTAETMTLCMGLALTTYLTSALKDLMCSPRPNQAATASQRAQMHPAASDDERGFTEYGAPSTHMSAGLFAALALVHTLLGVGVLPETLLGFVGSYSAAALWGAWIGLTRVYLCVHAPLDLMLGSVVGGSVFAMWAAAAGHHHDWVTGGSPTADADAPPSPGGEGPSASAAVVSLFALMPAALRAVLMVGGHAWALLRYPTPMHRTESYEHATTFIGAWGGFPVAHGSGLSKLARMSRLAPMAAAASRLPPPVARAIYVSAGLAIVLLTRVVAKAALTPVVSGLLALLPHRVRLALQPPLAHAPLQVAGPGQGVGKLGDGGSGGGGAVVIASVVLPGKGGRKGNGGGDGGKGRAGGRPAPPTRGGADEAAAAAVHVGIMELKLRRRRPAEGNSSGGLPAGKALEGPGLPPLAAFALRPDGYPCDADAIRRYVCYCLMVVVLVVYHDVVAELLAEA